MAHIFLIHILKFALPNLGIYEEIFKNVPNNYQSMVTTLNKAISNISIIFSNYFEARYKSAVFSLWMSYIHKNWPYLKSLNNFYFPKLSGQAPLKVPSSLLSILPPCFHISITSLISLDFLLCSHPRIFRFSKSMTWFALTKSYTHSHVQGIMNIPGCFNLVNDKVADSKINW